MTALNSHAFHSSLLRRLESPLEISESEVGLRKRDFDTKYVSESYVAIRAPSSGEWLLPPHIDSHFALTSMVHFFRAEDDDDDSGSLLILRENGKARESIDLGSLIDYFKPDSFDVAREIPYLGNSAICFLRTPSAWHAIGPRLRNQRRSLNISLELQNNGHRKRSS